MSKLEWDKVGERTYETGVDRGVLYLPEGGAVPWNGLTEVTESRGREVKSYYIDGVKYLDHHVPGSFSGKIKAFTYPNEVEVLMGNLEFAPGVVVHDQPAGIFNLSYRTRIGNDLDGIDHGYKIHILYNLMATANDVGFASVGAEVTPQVFEWNLTGTPATMFGIRPTAHISIDSRRIDPVLLQTIEDFLYGTEEIDPELPDPITLMGMAEA
jgi:hypothetical protein